MKSDFELIQTILPQTQEKVNIYPIGDPQVGSPNFSKELFWAWRDKVLSDPFGKVVIVGDMINNAVRNGKTNVYGELMRPSVAKSWLTENLKPIAHTVIGGVRGNHEARSVNEVDDCPLYDVMCKLDLEDLYREEACFIKLNVGKKANGKQVSYTLVLQHGTSESKTEKFGYAIDNMDVYFTGHVHRPKSSFPAKIVIDSHNNVVRLVDFTHIIVPSFDKFGGYVLRGQYLPQSSSKIPVVELSGREKEVSVHWLPLKFL